MLILKDIIKLQQKPDDMIIEGENRNTKLMFHKVNDNNVNPHYKMDNFENFQKEHLNKFFENTLYILSFWYEGKTAEFIGAYKLGDPVIEEVVDSKTNKSRIRYTFPNMKSISFMDDYKNRLYIEWTNPTANYGRWITDDNNEIHSIKYSKMNSVENVPKDFFNIRLEFYKLQKIKEYPVDNENWISYLSNHCGVYLILDKKEGNQYIGSAYGNEGFWGRWKKYIETKHGDNESLIKLINQDENYCDNFQFSILWVTLKTTEKNKITDVESEFKENLGTRVFGLNNN